MCVSSSSVAVVKHHDEDNMYKEEFNWEVVSYSYRVLVHDQQASRQGTRAAAEILHVIHKMEAESCLSPVGF